MLREILIVLFLLFSVGHAALNVTGNQVESLWSGIYDETGKNPLAYGRVYTYIGGSGSISKPLYTDSALSTQASNPLILDVAGRAQVYAESGPYRFVIYDKNNNLLRTLDHLSYPNLPQGSVIVSLTKTNRQGFATGTGSLKVTADSEILDPFDFHTSDNPMVTVNITGNYLVTGFSQWDTGATGGRRLQVLKNGSVVAESWIAASATEKVSNTVSCVLYLVAGDVIHNEAYQDNGSLISINSGQSGYRFDLVRLN